MDGNPPPCKVSENSPEINETIKNGSLVVKAYKHFSFLIRKQ